jgi:signal transduction histidine kinase
MQTVIRNLTSNAVKFTPRNGLVTWKGWSDGDQLVLTITDTGPGLSPNLLKGIHRGVLPESTQGTEGEPGTGLGLGLCFDFTKANQGTLVFRSPGLGTEATLRLPLFKPAAPPR